MNRNFAPNIYPAGTKVIYEDGTNNILRVRKPLSPGWYHLGKKIVAIDISEIRDNAVNQTEEKRRIAEQWAELAERRRIWEAGAEAREEQRRIAEERTEIVRRAAEQMERTAGVRREKMARERREREERMNREREEQAERRRIWEAGAEAREERRRIEALRPHDNNNPAPRNDYGPPGYGAGNPLYSGGRKSRRGRKNKKSKKSRSMKRRSNRRRRR